MGRVPERLPEEVLSPQFLVSVLLLSVPLILATVIACSREEARMPGEGSRDSEQTALAFSKALVARDYSVAHAMTSRTYRDRMSLEQVQSAFETIIPTDWGTVEPIEVAQTLRDWPSKEDSDLGWVYVSLGGDVYSEAVVVVVTLEDGEPRVRDVEFGRP
jgi:hypothetical protein